MKNHRSTAGKILSILLFCSLITAFFPSCQRNYSTAVIEPVSSLAPAPSSSNPASSSSLLEPFEPLASSAVESPASNSSSQSCSSDEVKSEPSSTESSSISQVKSKEDSGRILDVALIYQEPELPTGCEVTALAMAMKYAGYEVGKTTLAKTFLPKSSNFYYVGNKRYGPDFRTTFAGNPFTKNGYVCGAPAITTTANAYFDYVDSLQKAVNITGSSPEDLYKLVCNDTPVVVWVTIDMVQRNIAGGWYVEGTDEYIEWSRMDHCAVLTGVTEDEVVISDPISGKVTYSKSRFESVFEQRGRQAVIIE